MVVAVIFAAPRPSAGLPVVRPRVSVALAPFGVCSALGVVLLMIMVAEMPINLLLSLLTLALLSLSTIGALGDTSL
jgi:hypothetical protein